VVAGILRIRRQSYARRGGRNSSAPGGSGRKSPWSFGSWPGDGSSATTTAAWHQHIATPAPTLVPVDELLEGKFSAGNMVFGSTMGSRRLLPGIAGHEGACDEAAADPAAVPLLSECSRSRASKLTG
jgi:hypothetical protein